MPPGGELSVLRGGDRLQCGNPASCLPACGSLLRYNLLFSSINVPEEDLSKITEFLNKRAEFDIMGDDRYRMSRSFDILEKAASNEGGAGAIASAGVGLGMGLGIAPLMGQMAQQTTINPTNVCYHCKRELPQDAMFCPFCGSKKNRTCINCNKELTNDVLFCPYCGTKQG